MFALSAEWVTRVQFISAPLTISALIERKTMDESSVAQFKIDSMRYALKGEPLILDEWISKMAVNNATFLEEKIRLVIKPRPKLVPEKLWLKLAAKFLEINKLQ